MENVAFFRQLVSEAREFFEGTIADVTADEFTWEPGGRAVPIAAHYAHVVVAQDRGLHRLLLGTSPLAAGEIGAKAGIQEMPPFGQPWDEWAHRSKANLPGMRAYAAVVYAASDQYFGDLADADLRRPVDLSQAGYGTQTAQFVLVNGWIANVHMHCGEISCIKGLRGRQGYPA
ncbi:MAG: DinB family protein [Chloroflexi bacterium]|nr:DinB family protein [Chloroflexota bacterium]